MAGFTIRITRDTRFANQQHHVPHSSMKPLSAKRQHNFSLQTTVERVISVVTSARAALLFLTRDTLGEPLRLCESVGRRRLMTTGRKSPACPCPLFTKTIQIRHVLVNSTTPLRTGASVCVNPQVTSLVQNEGTASIWNIYIHHAARSVRESAVQEELSRRSLRHRPARRRLTCVRSCVSQAESTTLGKVLVDGPCAVIYATLVAHENMEEHAKIRCWNKTHSKMKWKLALRIATSPSERWLKKAAEWNPELSSRYRTNRTIGRPKKRWEDDINDFLKQNLDERENEEPLERKNQNNNIWINIASDRKEWTRLEEKIHNEV